MSAVKKSVVMPYSSKLIYDLVNDVSLYPEFVDWCVEGREVSRSEDAVVAELVFEFHGVSYAFSTRNQLSPHDRIDVSLIDGPFKHLQGHWLFENLNEAWCRVTLELEFEFKFVGLNMIFEPIFTSMANHWVESFCKRAGVVNDRSAGGVD
jgi:ribosome-associated toxin RatA of RatAB toxin-antitoxin module